MKIAVIVWGYYSEGGSQKQAIYLANKLSENGNEVLLYSFFGKKNNPYNNILKNITTKSLFECDDYKTEDDLIFLNKIFKKNILIKTLYLNYTINKLSKKLAKIIDTDVDIINVHDRFVYRVSYYFKKKHKKTPSIWMANDIPSYRWNSERFEQVSLNIINKLLRFLLDIYEKKFIKKQDLITVLDNINKNALKKYFNVYSHIVRSGVDNNYFTTDDNLYIKKIPPIRILMTGILAPHRRFEDTILAINILRKEKIEILLNIIGDYKNSISYKKYLDEIIEKNKLQKNVNFLGSVNEDELLKNYREHDIFIFPNHIQTWGLVVFEAMACGLPTLVSKTTGASEVLSNNVNSLLVNPKSPQEIAEKITKLIYDNELYIKIQKNGLDFIKDNISWDKYCFSMLELMKNIIFKA